MMEVIDFLKWIVESERLEIATYLPEMEDESFFLVAATGLGKTVAVPVHILIRQMQRTGSQRNPAPRVWVIEPRIPIAVEQAEYMNKLWDEYRIKQSRTHQKTKPLFGCVTSASGRVNPDAPIQFVTTGIFELLSREGKLDAVSDRVIIDEAHVTVEQNPGVEIGIALCWKAGVTVDYMSATVDVSTIEADLRVSTIVRADKARNIIWKSNLLKPIDEAIVDLVNGTLVNPKRDSMYYPSGSFQHAKAVIDSAFESHRSHGMLIVVNSFNGLTSDTQKLTDTLRKQNVRIPVLHLASDVIRDPRRQREFKTRLSDIERRNENYIIIATSVVEMGITFPTLDYVVTMDSGYDQETIGDVSFPVVAPLGVNSLLQRIGRVGRRRPGIAYISTEVGAEYASLEDTALNSNALKYESIRFPLSSAPLMPLAYYAAQQTWSNVDEWLASLQLPSRIHENPDRMEYFHEQFEKLERLGITKEGKLTELGVAMEHWIGRADIAYAAHLQKRLKEGASQHEVLFWIVATALSNTSSSSLKAQYGYFVDYNASHKEVANRIDVWSGTFHEDLALFQVITRATETSARYLWNKSNRNALVGGFFYKWCNWAGLDARKVIKAAQAISDTFVLFAKINAKSNEFKSLFGTEREFRPETIDWTSIQKKLPVKSLITQLMGLAGVTKLEFAYSDALQAFEWSDQLHGHVGVLSQDDTPIQLKAGLAYSARVTPSREMRGADASWRVTSLGTVPVSEPTSKAVAAPKKSPSSPKTRSAPPKKKSFFERLFGL